MADRPSFDEPLRRAIDANVRYCEALGRVTQDYWKAIFGIVRELPVRLATGGGSAPPAPVPANPSAPATAASLVLEAPAGAEAHGMFLVENRLSGLVSTAVVTSAFADPSGRAVRPTIRVEPGIVTLPPGGRTLIQIAAIISDDLAPEVPYRGEVSVPGLSEHGIPVLLRRLTSAMTPADEVANATSAKTNDGVSASAGPAHRAAGGTSKKRPAVKKQPARRRRPTGRGDAG